MSTLTWPVPDSKRITSSFNPARLHPTKGVVEPHNGIDIGGDGLNIVAALPGRVIDHLPNNPSGGNMLSIDHGDGVVTRYLHMRSGSNTVSNGSIVSAGQVIGKVGSTGRVTGPHLHFEYKIDGKAVDPVPYFSSEIRNSLVIQDGGSPSTSDTISSGSENSFASGDIHTSGSVPYNPDYVIATRTSNFTEGRPVHGYFKLLLGDLELKYDHSKPDIYESLEIQRLERAGCTAQFVIFDDNWEEIEVYLADHWMDARIVYGYSEGISSPQYQLILQDYNIDFKDNGVILSIRAISESIYKNLNSETEFDTETKNPKEAIIRICEYLNIDIDESYLANTPDVEREENYKLTGENPITYINEIIIPETVTDGKETYSFYFDYEGKPHLVKKDYSKTISEDTDDVRTYVYQKGYDSVVESLSVDIKGVFGGTSEFSIDTELTGSVFGTYDKVEYSGKENLDSVITNTATTGRWSHTMLSQATGTLPTAGESYDQMKNKLNYYVYNAVNDQYTATMTILGDPSIELFEDVRILNITEFGHLHHTSGIYKVIGIIDTVTNGEFRTTLKLQRNGDINLGLRLLNPKTIAN